MYNSQELAMLIKKLLKDKSITVGKMLSDCQLSINTLSSMQAGGYYPRLEAIVKISDYLDVSIDYLLGRDSGDKLSADEHAILNAYRAHPEMHEESKGGFMYITQDIANRIKQQAKNKKIAIKDLLSDCEMNINAISEFSKGKQLSCISLANIADCLDCSVDYLLGRDSSEKLTADEHAILNAYRAHPEMHEAVNKLLGISDENNIRLVAAPKVTPPVIDLDSDEEKLT